MHHDADRQSVRHTGAARRPGSPRCTVCGRPIAQRLFDLHGTCGREACWEKQRARQLDLRPQPERQQRIAEGLRRRVIALRDRTAGAMGIDRPEMFVPMVVSAYRAPLAALPPARRQAFRDRLACLVREACRPIAPTPRASGDCPGSRVSEDGTVSFDADASQRPMQRDACALCQGLCCRRGGDHAFLDVGTIRHYMSEHPTQGPAEVLDAYLSRLGDRTYEGSCVCHGEQGCVLDGDMRADLCTSFECSALKRLREDSRGQGPHRVFLAAVDEGEIVRFAFLVSPPEATSLCLSLGWLDGLRL